MKLKIDGNRILIGFVKRHLQIEDIFPIISVAHSQQNHVTLYILYSIVGN